MKANRRHTLVLAGAGAAALALPSLAAAARPAVLRLGQSAPMEGANGAVGRQFRDTTRRWFDSINAEGGVAGYHLELVALDDGGQVERSATNAKLLAATHGVMGFFGFAGPGANRSGMQAASEEGVPFIAPVSGMDVLRQRANSNVYLLRAGHRDEIRQIIRHTSSLGVGRIALLFEYESAGWEIRDSFTEAAEAASLAKRVSASVSRGSSDVESAVAVLGAADPQAIILAANTEACAAFVRAMRKAGFGGTFYTVSTVGGQSLLDQLGALAAGISVAQVVPFPWNGATPVSREFLAFCAAARITPDFASMEAYLAARWLTGILKLNRPRDASAAGLRGALDNMPAFQIGGFPLAFNPLTRSASNFVELTVVSTALKFRK